MNEQELEQKLSDLFSDLAAVETSTETTMPVPVVETDRLIYQLLGLFSDQDDVAQAARLRFQPEEQAELQVELQERPQLAPPSSQPVRPAPPEPRPPRALIEDDVVKLVKSKQPAERRQAVQNLARLGSEWVIDPLLYAATDGDRVVAQLALDALSQMPEAVNQRVLSLAPEPASPLQPGAAAYLTYRLGQPVVYIPPGPFIMGSDSADDLAGEDEQPQHQLDLPGCWIARYPLTAARFQLFLRESDYHPQRGSRRHGADDYPAGDVTWHDALAYCRWSGDQTGLPVTLPSEAEWEKAARGTDGRPYPWGDQAPTPDRCNVEELTPVGHYSPLGDSPYGCADMIGSAWEWTRSLYRPYPYQPDDGRETLTGEDPRVIRGLTPNNTPHYTRCAFRYRLNPILHVPVLGFRVVVCE